MDWSVSNAYKTLKDIEPKSMMDMSLIPNIDPIDIALPSSEKGNAASAAKPRKKTMTSVFLKFFETALDGKSRRCKFCGQSYSIATATGNLGRHLTNRHPGYDKSVDVVTKCSSQTITVVKKPQPQAKTPEMDLDHLNWLLIKWLILASLPPSSLEERWLANSFKYLNPSFQLWPGEKVHAVLHEVFRSMREDVRTTLEQVSSKVSVTLDFWTSYEQLVYMSVTCQWIEDNWSFQKILLDVCHIPSPCGGTEIYHALVKVLKMYNIDTRVLSCTHDNSPDALHACHTLKDDIDSQKLGPFCYVPCAARTLNSIITEALRTTKSVICKIREFVLVMNSSVLIAEDFQEFATACHEGSWKFPLDASARWSGHYQMLDIGRKASRSMETVIRKHEETLSSRLLLSSAEKNAVNIIHGFLEPFYKTTCNMSSNKVLTIGLVVFFMDHISEMIVASRDSRHSPDWLKNTAEEMAKKARKYNEQVCNIFTYMTAILDPRIKVELIPESLNLKNFLDEARAYFIRNYSTSHFPSEYGAPDMVDGGSVSFAEEIARKKRRGSMSSVTDELTQYLSEPPAPISTDVLEWWKGNSSRYPRLCVMARDFLAVQATSVAPEELFCRKGDEIYRQRFAVAHDTVQSLLCIKSWSEAGVKLKYKSSEIDYESLMELAAKTGAGSSDRKPS